MIDTGEPKMKNQDLKVGDTVMLSSGSKWTINILDNPLNVVGEVVEKGNSWVFVQWSNGGYNSYKSKDSDLILCNNSDKEPDMQKNNTTKDLIDNISHAYEILCNSENAVQMLQQEVVNNRKAYEDAVEELQKSVQDKGFKVESIQDASSKPKKNFDRYSYWDVSEWTEEEIEKAADILAEEFGANKYSLDIFGRYYLLLIDAGNDILVQSYENLTEISEVIGKEFNQRTKQDIL
tara:strand:+ start:25104 stop:25808 length:705 start_codon:yes stop_codon:yes gene_type:complete